MHWYAHTFQGAVYRYDCRLKPTISHLGIRSMRRNNTVWLESLDIGNAYAKQKLYFLTFVSDACRIFERFRHCSRLVFLFAYLPRCYTS